MIVSLRDNVQRLISQAESADRHSVPTYLRLLDQRRDWVKGELDVEGMLSEPPKAPLGIPENIYDLATLSLEPIDERRRSYQRMLELIDRTMANLWERMLSVDEATE
jgi:hypothetical protein